MREPLADERTTAEALSEERQNGHSAANDRPTRKTSPKRKSRGLTRRQFLPRAAGLASVVAGAGVAGYELSGQHHADDYAQQASGPRVPGSPFGQVQSFLTRPDLKPPPVRVTRLVSDSLIPESPRFILTSPINYFNPSAAQQGLMIVDRRGRLVYFKPISGATPFDFSVQAYKDENALTWWQGLVTNAHGVGTAEVRDSSYKPLRSIRVANGLATDLHEINLTSRGTALVTAYEPTTADLSSIGGSSKAKVFAGHAQEIDLATGRVLFDWNSLEHVGVQESFQKASATNGDVYDYFHINSVDEMDDGNLLISARNTWTLYKVDRSSGKVLWRMNGKRSDFTLSRAARFYWQHHVRAHGLDTISLFDNTGPREGTQSRALVLAINPTSRYVDVAHQYVHPTGLLTNTLGSTQLLDDGRVFVGWGNQPFFTEFASDGSVLLDGELPFGIRSYRAVAADWVGHPADPPAIVARANPANGFIVYASWNGATEVDRWQVLAGSSKSSLEPMGSQPWAGFETAIAVNSAGPHFAVVALDQNGNELGRSAVI
jgi:hypothetical protein